MIHLYGNQIIKNNYLGKLFLKINKICIYVFFFLGYTISNFSVVLENMCYSRLRGIPHRMLSFSFYSAPSIFLYSVTVQKSTVSVSSEVRSTNKTAHPPARPPIHLIHPSVQLYIICPDPRRQKNMSYLTRCSPCLILLE